MFSLKIQNARNEIFELSHNTRNYYVIGVQGLTPPTMAVNTTGGGTLDGTFYNSSKLNQRNIVITIVLNGDIEKNRQNLYQIFNLKKPCTIYFKNASRNIKIVGYVEALEGDLFSQREQVQISIICPRPYFEDLNTIYTELSRLLNLFEFPFAIEQNTPVPFSEIQETPFCTVTNSGDVDTGVTMRISFSGSVSNLKIYNSTTQKFIGFDFTFSEHDELKVSTFSGSLGASLTRNGETLNMLSWLMAGSSWLKLIVGDNDFTFTASNVDNVSIILISANLYGGV